MVKTRLALSDLEESLGPAMADLWEQGAGAPNPFETRRKDEHPAKVQRELAAEAATKKAEGEEDAGDVKGDMPFTELIAMGLQLEEQQ